MRSSTGSIMLAAILATTGCYTVNLQSIPDVPGKKLQLSAQLEIPPETAAFTYDVRSAAAGVANRFRILVGATLTQYAASYLGPIFPAGDDLTIGISIEGFDVHDFEAHIDARFVITQDKAIVFNKKYHANGKGYFARTVWGGVFAMKSSMRKTTNEALRSLFEQFLADVHAEYTGWAVEDVDVPIEDLATAEPWSSR